MATRTKGRKAAAKKQSSPAKKASANGGQKREAIRDRDAKTMEKVVEMRGKDKSWSDIGTKLSITPGKAQFLFMVSEVKPSEKIKDGTDAQLGKAIAALRKQGLSWGQIAARTYHLGIAEGRVKALAEKAGVKVSGTNVAKERAGSSGRKAAKATGKTKTKKRRRRSQGNPSSQD